MLVSSYLVCPSSVGLMFYCRCFIFLFQSQDLQDVSADWREILHSDQSWARFWNASPKCRGRPTPKNFRG